MKHSETSHPPSSSKQDKALFRQAMADVQPLRHKSRILPHSATPSRPRHTFRPTPPSFTEEVRYLPAEDSFHELKPESTLYWSRQPLRPQDERRLKQGRFQTPWELDLHGLTEEEAHRTLLHFLREAWQMGARHARIIHGKGYHTPDGVSILKKMVAQSLTRLPFVLAFCSARPRDGGAGAVYVFLKKHPDRGMHDHHP